jgi:FkbM family methyltransferase
MAIGKDLDKELRDAKKTLGFLKGATGKCLLDCGANVGFVAERMLEAFTRIIAIEAHPTTFARLKKRMAKHTHVTCLEATVRGLPDETPLFISSPGNSTGATITAKPRKKTPGWYTKAAKTILMKDLIKTYKPDAIKMDIEGSEYDIILNTKLTGVKLLVVEYHQTRGAKRYKSFRECEKFLKVQGFKRTRPKPTPRSPCYRTAPRSRTCALSRCTSDDAPSRQDHDGDGGDVPPT